MPSSLEKGANLVLTIAALSVAAVVVRRELAPQSASRVSNSNVVTIELDRDWERMLDHGLRVGSADAPIKVIEFVDFECPVCRAFHRTILRELQRKYGNRLSLTYVHSPIPSHRFAMLAARAVECAATSGRATGFVDVVFEKQDSLGIKTWASYGAEAGISDTTSFATCVLHGPSFPRIDSGAVLVEGKEIRGTPTFFLNGWRFSNPPRQNEFERVADAILAGHKPVL